MSEINTAEKVYVRDLGVESAFARNGVVLPNDQVDYGDVGLTKRELFAAMAMQGLLSQPTMPPDGWSKMAVLQADELLKELAK